MTTILTLVQDFCEKTGLPRPSALVGVTEKSVSQFRALLTECVEDLAEYPWREQTLRKTWTSLAGQDQGTLDSIFGAGYRSWTPGTMWNDTRKMQIYGPVSDQQWQVFQTLPNAGPEYQSWISGGHLYISPALPAGENLSAIYSTNYGVLDLDGVTTKPRITADSDSLLFPDNVVKRCLEYKWRKQKGEAGWEDDYNAFIGLVARSIVKDGAKTLSLSPNPIIARPGIVVPSGSWNV
jgi:hypothetical protein